MVHLPRSGLALAASLLVLSPSGALAAPGGEPRVGDVLGGTYRLDRVLGGGAMGVVYAATELRSEDALAIKWMRASPKTDSDGAMRLMREYLVSTKVEHDNIVDVRRVGRHEGRFFLVMELLEGEPLSAVIERGALAPLEAAALISPALDGVAAAHAAGVVHRDLKPSNIFVLSEGGGGAPHVKVIDFGLCKVASAEDELDLKLTQQVKALGTPLYMSPEQIRDPSGVDHRTDIYSLGVVLYEMLTQKLPFSGTGYNDLIIKVATETPRAPHELVPAIDARLSDVVMKAMARDPDARFQEVAALSAALSAAIEPPVMAAPGALEPVAAAPAAAGGPIPHWAFDAVAIGGAFAIGIAMFARRRRRPPRDREQAPGQGRNAR